MRIANIYTDETYERLRPTRMSTIRWLRMSEALAGHGHHVDVIINSRRPLESTTPRLRFIPWSEAHWKGYDAIKTNYQRGFGLLEKYGGADHPFVIARLASVVGSDDSAKTSFAGRERTILRELQGRISERAKVVVVHSEAEKRFWMENYGSASRVVVVPTGVDTVIPSPKSNPYEDCPEKVVVFIGNLRGSTRRYASPSGRHLEITTQAEINNRWQARLNSLGRAVRRRGIRLYVIGDGAVDKLDANAVTCLGPVEYERIWDYHYFADVGIALALSPGQLHECSKLYSYLRAGLPTVSEASIPTNDLIHATGLGFVVDDHDDYAMAEMIGEAANREWDSRDAVSYMLSNHTWSKRAEIYNALMR